MAQKISLRSEPKLGKSTVPHAFVRANVAQSTSFESLGDIDSHRKISVGNLGPSSRDISQYVAGTRAFKNHPL